jgi:hypothetical protein
MKYSEAGKGSAPRKNADQEAYAQNHEKIFGAVGPLARKKQEEALKKIVEFSEENKLYSEFEIFEVDSRKFAAVIQRNRSCIGCAGDDNVVCFALPDCRVSGVDYIFKEVLDK